MKLDGLLKQLENLRIQEENGEFQDDRELVALTVIKLLVEFINNKKVEEKIDEISF